MILRYIIIIYERLHQRHEFGVPYTEQYWQTLKDTNLVCPTLNNTDRQFSCLHQFISSVLIVFFVKLLDLQ